MPLPPGLLSTLAGPDFWPDYLMLDAKGRRRRLEYPEVVNHAEPLSAEALAERAIVAPDDPLDDPFTHSCRIDFPVGPRYTIRLDLNPWLDHFLMLVRPDGTDAELGWIDCHNHEDALRCEEWDLIGRCLALADPDLPHPGLPALLLNVYAPITDSEPAAARIALLRGAMRTAGLDPAVLPRLLHFIDNRTSRFVWRSGPAGWWLEQDGDWLNDRLPSPLYTIRHPTNVEYPFADVATLFADADRVCREAVRPEWRTPVVVGLAEAVADGQFDRLPVLADALEEAGCDHPSLLAHLRHPDPARGAWVAELVLGCDWGTFLARLP